MSTLNVETAVIQNLPNQEARMVTAWATFDSSGSQTIKGSYNVSTLTDLGVGITRVTYTNTYVSTEYCLITDSQISLGTLSMLTNARSDRSVTECTIYTRRADTSDLIDVPNVNMQITGGTS